MKRFLLFSLVFVLLITSFPVVSRAEEPANISLTLSDMGATKYI